MASRARSSAVVGELLGAARRTAQGVATESGAQRAGVSGDVGSSGRAWYSSLADRVAQSSSVTSGLVGSAAVSSSIGNGVQQAVRHFNRGFAPSFPRASPRLPHGVFPSTVTALLAPRVRAVAARNGKKVLDGKAPLSRSATLKMAR